MSDALLSSVIEGIAVRSGKVRDMYDLGDQLLMVSTDRISAFDWVLPTGIPDKGRVLTQISKFWFERLDDPHHVISTELDPNRLPAGTDVAALEGRSMLVRKSEVVPIECVVRGYLAGSGWKEYQQTGDGLRHRLPPGLRQCDQLPEPIFTPATKDETGHDENISFETMIGLTGAVAAEELRRRSLESVPAGRRLGSGKRHHHRRHEVRVGLVRGRVDPDRRGADAGQLALLAGRSVRAGHGQPSFDKQFVRDWLQRHRAGTRTARRPRCPPTSCRDTREKYIEAFERLTDLPFPWK